MSLLAHHRWFQRAVAIAVTAFGFYAVAPSTKPAEAQFVSVPAGVVVDGGWGWGGPCWGCGPFFHDGRSFHDGRFSVHDGRFFVHDGRFFNDRRFFRDRRFFHDGRFLHGGFGGPGFAHGGFVGPGVAHGGFMGGRR